MSQKSLLFAPIHKKKKKTYHFYNPQKKAFKKIVHSSNYTIGPAEFKVILKIRPILFEEKQVSLFETVKVLDRESLIMRPKNQQDQASIYRANLEKIIPEIFQGINYSIICYGGACSGKTYTLLGNIQDNGLLLDYLYGIFDYMDENNLREKTSIFLSIMEYSNESFKDLLVKTNFELKLYENLANQVSLIGLTRVKIESLKDGLKLLRIATKNNVSRDIFNEKFAQRKHVSLPKSHFLVELNIEYLTNAEFKDRKIFSRVLFIDLGGILTSKYEEDQSIVDSLLAFSNCIRRLSEICTKMRKDFYIPYNSNLFTRFIRDSLGGNSKTIFFGAITPFVQYIDYTITTLRHCIQLKNIRSSPQNNALNLLYYNLKYYETLEFMKRHIRMVKEILKKYDLQNKKKQFQMKMIVEMMQNVKAFLLDFLSKIQAIVEAEKAYSKKSQEVLDLQMAVYSKVITINDLKQFYLAKLQGYLREELESGLAEKIKDLPFYLQQIHDGYEEMKKSLKFMRVLKNQLDPETSLFKGNELAYMADILITAKDLLFYYEFFKIHHKFDHKSFIYDISDLFSDFLQFFPPILLKLKHNSQGKDEKAKKKNEEIVKSLITGIFRKRRAVSALPMKKSMNLSRNSSLFDTFLSKPSNLEAERTNKNQRVIHLKSRKVTLDENEINRTLQGYKRIEKNKHFRILPEITSSNAEFLLEKSSIFEKNLDAENENFIDDELFNGIFKSKTVFHRQSSTHLSIKLEGNTSHNELVLPKLENKVKEIEDSRKKERKAQSQILMPIKADDLKYLKQVPDMKSFKSLQQKSKDFLAKFIIQK